MNSRLLMCSPQAEDYTLPRHRRDDYSITSSARSRKRCARATASDAGDWVLDPRSPGTFEGPLRAFRQGLKDTAYVEGENVAKVVDDIGLTTKAPQMASLSYWRNLRKAHGGTSCPCRDLRRES
jgi:hypothetical protein